MGADYDSPGLASAIYYNETVRIFTVQTNIGPQSRNWLMLGTIMMIALMLPDFALACQCAPKPPPCQAIGQSELVFIGTVIEIPTSEPFTVARIHVQRVYKGTLPSGVILSEEGKIEAGDTDQRRYPIKT